MLLRWLINTLALILVSKIVEGFHVDTFFHALIAALVLGLVNATIRWVLLVLTLPINVLTLGLFTFVINALMILFVANIVKGFSVDGFMPALWAALVLWAISWITNSLIGGNEQPQKLA
jgi:putative membrane protein